MATLTAEQFQTLLETIGTARGPATQAVPRNNPAALGPMKPCIFGANKMMRLHQFETWLEEARNRMTYLGTTEDNAKIILLRSWGGADLVDHMKTAKVKFEAVEATIDAAAIPRDTYEDVINKIKTELRSLVNKTMATHLLLTTKQGERGWKDFIKDIEEKARILDFNITPYRQDDAIKDAAIFGMADTRLREKALAEDPDLPTLISWGQSREAGREGAHHLKDKTSPVNRLTTEESLEMPEIDDMIHTLQVMKLRKSGRYSTRAHRLTPNKNQCMNCSGKHQEGKCPAKGRECFACGKRDHFVNAQSCPKRTPKIRQINPEGDHPSSQHCDSGYNDTRTQFSEYDTYTPFQWPGVNANDTSDVKLISCVNQIAADSQLSKRVKVEVGGIPMILFTDTGSEFTIIPPSSYKPQMGHVMAADTHLRAWGSKTKLDVKGMVSTTLTTEKGATSKSKVYIVDGFHPEPLMGDRDAQKLGFIVFNKEGREPKPTQPQSIKYSSNENHCLPQKLRERLNVKIQTKGEVHDAVPMEESNKVKELLKRYQGLVFEENKIGQINTKPIHLDYDKNFKPVQPSFRNILLHYQAEVSRLLQFLREQGVITDADPTKSYDCVMNVVITDKKDGNIRMNIDNTPQNPGMKRTKFHVQTPQEIRHELKEAKIFTEMDMGWAYHQLETDESTRKRSIFQTHEGIHRMERLYFGPTASSGIFHSEIRKALQGLQGVINIHDNILVWGRNHADHVANLTACLERCASKGIVLKSSKTNTCMNRIKWFGRTFTSDGVTADEDKMKDIISNGKPSNTEDIRSFLMACQYNAKFLFDNPDVKESYEQVTAPLRKLLKRDQKFIWGKEQNEAYTKLLMLMESPATLRPYDLSRKTYFAADSSEVGIQSSIYQEIDDKTWVPIDHTSRTLTDTEQNYSPIERESLAQSWGMDQFRFYLVGGTFTAWTDHEPLPAIYNKRNKPTTKRIGSHRDQITDLQYTMKWMPGKEMPCDYGSRHAYPIDHLSEKEQEKLGCDNGKIIYVRKIDIGHSPDAIKIADIKTAALRDPTYQAITKAIKAGSKHHSKTPLAFKRVWNQLSVIEGILHKGSKIVVPNAEIYPGAGNIRQHVLDIAHEGHQGMGGTKQHLRATLWFPRMDEVTEELVSSCLPCQAATETKHRDPNIPSEPPKEPWQKLAADHWGPTADGKYLLVIVDELSRYPEVAIVNSTSADDNIEAFDSILSRHGFCESLKTDNGPPFNGKESHQLQQYFKWAGI